MSPAKEGGEYVWVAGGGGEARGGRRACRGNLKIWLTYLLLQMGEVKVGGRLRYDEILKNVLS